jgi:riboflavin kinase/FMN adenylyltransferase
MITQFGTPRLALEWPASVVCIGTFDGIHRGHQRVIETAVLRAREAEIPSVAVTFDRHPAAILAPSRRPPYIASLDEDLSEFARLGVDATVVLPFNASLSRMSANEFLAEILVGKIKASEVVIGHDFALGNGREGTADWLGQRIPTTSVPGFEWLGERVSSSRIREFIANGEIVRANDFLGRPFRISGVVVSGQKLGRQLGFPTANLARAFDQITPRDGVYAAVAETKFGRFAAALAIGMRPAVQGTSRTIEAYLLDYPGDSLYGSVVSLELKSFVRPEENFSNLDALVAQMEKDVSQIRQIIGSQ